MTDHRAALERARNGAQAYWREKRMGWVAVDLDGTLARYEGWQGEEHIGDPVPAMVERVRRWLAEGRDVRIFTARVSKDPNGVVKRAIKAWCLEHIGVALPVTNVKDYAMLELYDDRAVQVELNTGRLIGQSTRGI